MRVFLTLVAAFLGGVSFPQTGLPDAKPHRDAYYFADPYASLPSPNGGVLTAQPADTAWQKPVVTFEEPDLLLRLIPALKGDADSLAQGYRVQVFTGKRADATRSKFDFMARYPEYNVYTVFESPYYKVRVGDFRKQVSADRLADEIRPRFPGAFVVPDIIRAREDRSR